MNITKLTDAVGVEVSGVDLSRDVDDNTIAQIREAWTQHGIVLFRRQSITIPQQIAFTKRFGELYIDLSDDFTHPEHREVFVLSNIKENGEFIGLPPEQTGEAWHSDLIYREEPAAGAFFYAKEAPPEGGDTHFAGMYAAYDALPQDRQEQIDQLKCRYSRTKVYELGIFSKDLLPLSEADDTFSKGGAARRRPPHGAHSPRDRPQSALRRHARLEGNAYSRHAGRRGTGVARRPAHIRDPAAIRLPPSLECRRRDHVGQPLHHAPGQRFRSGAGTPSVLPHHDRWRRTVLGRLLLGRRLPGRRLPGRRERPANAGNRPASGTCLCDDVRK